eukprot:15434157-Alexandrium_andersonii.AAC.2
MSLDQNVSGPSERSMRWSCGPRSSGRSVGHLHSSMKRRLDVLIPPPPAAAAAALAPAARKARGGLGRPAQGGDGGYARARRRRSWSSWGAYGVSGGRLWPFPQAKGGGAMVRARLPPPQAAGYALGHARSLTPALSDTTCLFRPRPRPPPRQAAGWRGPGRWIG